MDLQLPELLAANDAYQRRGEHTAPRTPQPARRLAILTCMDARLDLFRALGLRVGDAHLVRNAGGRASPDALRSLVVSAHLLGSREIGVIHHTNCGMEGSSDEEIAAKTGVADLEFRAFADLEDSVREDVDIIRGAGYFPDGLTVWGAIYDVDSGDVRIVVEPAPVRPSVPTE